MDSLLLPTADIRDLIEDEAGVLRDASELVGNDRDEVMRLYKRLHVSLSTGRNRILCEICSVPVYLVSRRDTQRFFFRHIHEDGNCPSKSRGDLTESQINALRYHGQRESQRHFRLKNLIADSLRRDPKFTEPVVEGSWKGKDNKELRRPDVRSRFADAIDVAFEVQLSTTFGRVMAEREVFYKNEGGLLVWIFGNFDPDHARLMMEVIFVNNNRNAFVVNEATEAASLESGCLVVECHWLQPSRTNDHITWIHNRRLVRFDELTLDQQNQRAYYVDTEAEEARIKAEIAGPPLAERFIEFWLAKEGFEDRAKPDYTIANEAWVVFQREFATQGARLPPRSDYDFIDVMRTMLLAKLGKAVGWGYKDFKAAAHHVHDDKQRYLWMFVPALRHYGRLADIEREDKNGKWQTKMMKWKEGVLRHEQTFEEDHRFNNVLRRVFPELAYLIPESDEIYELEDWDEIPF